MANIYTSADQLIGKTPLLELTQIEKSEGLNAKILAKLEYFNPAGSVKDRIAKAMIDDAEAKGILRLVLRSSSRLPETQESVLRRLRLPAVTGSLSLCLRP